MKNSTLFGNSVAMLVAFAILTAAPLSAQFLGPNQVVVATNSAWVNANAVMNGDVIVNSDNTMATLKPAADLVIERAATVDGNVHAQSIQINNNATVTGEIFTDVLEDKGGNCPLSGSCVAAGPHNPPVVTLPVFQQAQPGSMDVTVLAGQTLNLVAGRYGHITVGANATLIFVGGTGVDGYDVKSITAGQGSQLLFLTATDLRVEGQVTVGKDSNVGPSSSGINPSDVVIYGAGENADPLDPNSLPAAAHVGRDSTLAANWYVPNGTLRMDRGSSWTGAFIAKDVVVHGFVSQDSAFVNQPPLADPLDVFTDGAGTITISLSCTDPDNPGGVAGNLTFAIESDPTQGTLSAIMPIVPPLVPDRENPGADCGVNPELCVQGPITSATVDYTPNTGNDLEDSFIYSCTDPGGAQGAAAISINPFDPSPAPPALTQVTPDDVSRDTTTNVPMVVGLSAGACPDANPLVFAIESLPSDGSLSDTGGSITTVPHDLPDASVVYTPNSGFTGDDSFTYSARENPAADCPSGLNATVSIGVNEQFRLAPDQNLTTNFQTSLQVTLFGNAGGSGSPVIPLSAESTAVNQSAPPLPGAAIAGTASDADGNGFGDGRDNLPGPAPVLVAAGVDVNLGSASGSVTDPTGDALPGGGSPPPANPPTPDLVAASLSSDGTDLTIDIDFASGTFDFTTYGAMVLLDTDQDANTGCDPDEVLGLGGAGVQFDCPNGASGDLIGYDYWIQIPKPASGHPTAGGGTARVNTQQSIGNGGSFADVAFDNTADGFSLIVPLSALGGDDGNINFRIASFTHPAEGQSTHANPNSGELDFMPNLGLAPGQTAGTAGIQGVARTKIEWNITSLPAVDEIESCEVTLITNKGTVDSLDTTYLEVTADGDGTLEVSDYESPIGSALAVMPVSIGVAGMDVPFSFPVTSAVRSAINSGFSFFSIQGRVDEQLAGGGFQRGLQIRSTASGNLTAGTEPQLSCVTSTTPTGPQLVWRITNLTFTPPSTPTYGSTFTNLTDSLTGATVSVGATFTTQPTLVFTPANGFSGTHTITYAVVEDGLTIDTGIVDILVSAVSDGCIAVGREPGCAPNLGLLGP